MSLGIRKEAMQLKIAKIPKTNKGPVGPIAKKRYPINGISIPPSLLTALLKPTPVFLT